MQILNSRYQEGRHFIVRIELQGSDLIGSDPVAICGEFDQLIHDALTAAFADPTVKEAMAKQGNTIRVGTTEQAQAALRAELAKYAALVKKVGLEPQ